MRKKSSSGQVLILAALAIALISLSTISYMSQLNHFSFIEQPFDAESFISMNKNSLKNIMISVLRDVSKGAANYSLNVNFNRWILFVKSQYLIEKPSLSFKLCSNPPYSSGLQLPTGSSGFNVTSAKVDCLLNFTANNIEINSVFSINVTSYIKVHPVAYTQNNKQNVSVIVQLGNEEDFTLAKNITVYYRTNSSWVNAGFSDNYQLHDFGNGTYRASFTVNSLYPIEVSVHCIDLRGIYVQVNAKCNDF